MPAANERTKRIFISDVHMGDARSLEPPEPLHPYGWLQADRAEMLANFLQLKLNDEDVKEVVILGDLFDEWVCPTELEPVPSGSSPRNQYENIAMAPQNTGIIDNLRRIAAHGEMGLVYVPGNHDMLITEKILGQIIPRVVYAGDGPGRGVFTADGIGAEHGSVYCLFNAPDSYDNPDHVLPLGFFISRVIAEEVARTGASVNYLEVLAEIILRLVGDSEFAKAVFSATVDAADLSEISPIALGIKMSGIDGYVDPLPAPLQTPRVAEWFANLYDEWEQRMPDNVAKEEAVIDDTGNLYLPAVRQYFLQADQPDIVIFGHTHNFTIHGLPLLGAYKAESATLAKWALPCKHIYANCGTWVNAKKRCTFVETQMDEEAEKHYVRVMEYTKDGSIITLGQRHSRL